MVIKRKSNSLAQTDTNTHKNYIEKIKWNSNKNKNKTREKLKFFRYNMNRQTYKTTYSGKDNAKQFQN